MTATLTFKTTLMAIKHYLAQEPNAVQVSAKEMLEFKKASTEEQMAEYRREMESYGYVIEASA